MFYLSFVFENGDDVSFACKNIKQMTIGGDEYDNVLELSYLEGTVAKEGDVDHYEFGEFGAPKSSFQYLVSNQENIVQVILEDGEDLYDTYLVPDGMSFSYTVVNGDLSFVLE